MVIDGFTCYKEVGTIPNLMKQDTFLEENNNGKS